MSYLAMIAIVALSLITLANAIDCQYSYGEFSAGIVPQYALGRVVEDRIQSFAITCDDLLPDAEVFAPLSRATCGKIPIGALHATIL